MNWYHRDETRYVEYGTSFGASRTFGIRRSLTDTIYNMNGEHLAQETPTVFESLDDADIRTAGTTYLMYRGRHEHQPNDETALARLATQVFRKPVLGPAGVLLRRPVRVARAPAARRRWACRACATGTPAASGAYLMEHDLFDFLLLSLPDNDTYSHRNGPAAQVTSLAEADRQLERLMHVAGGPDAFLEDHAVIVCSRPLAVQGRGRDRPLRGLRRLRRPAADALDAPTSARSRCARRRARRRSTSSTPTRREDLLRARGTHRAGARRG